MVKIILGISIFLGINSCGYCQIIKNAFCPLNPMLVNTDTLFDLNSDPSIGISLKSNNKSVYAIADGIVTNIRTYNAGNVILTIKTKQTAITYSVLKDSKLKKGDTVRRGQLIGVLIGKTRELYILTLVMKTNNHILGSEDYKRVLKNCVNK